MIDRISEITSIIRGWVNDYAICDMKSERRIYFLLLD
ncbi:hypothetical protein MKC91_17700 [[Clostridium] innocuum]|nr:hypothetical protein [[Clostridium] innocuum]MCR0414693.1 hypothetical protein [[Clostridium] innocuum]MCR0535629.1 hypothetical protein [[Clostridium] innocuum]MCR0540236.1 hypothetical protein [[Clostridium] innocuum]